MGEFLEFLVDSDEGRKKLEIVSQNVADLRTRFEEGMWHWN